MTDHPASRRAVLPLLPTILILATLLAALWLRVDHFAQWPPGLSHDEAGDAVDAWRLATTGRVPLYLPFGNPEPMFRILAALPVALISPTAFGFRLTSLFAGVLAVAAAYRAGRHLAPPAFRQLPVASRQPPFAWPRLAGLAAASTLAILVGHIHLSRVGYRGILLPLALLLFFDAFVFAWRVHRRRYFVAAGLWLGVTCMTYTAGLAALPVAALGVLVALIETLTRRRASVRQALLHVLIMALAALIAFSPMIALWLVQPALYARAAEVSIEAERSGLAQLSRLWPDIRRTWKSMWLRGDINPSYNVAEMPVLFWKPLYWLLMAGIAACAVQIIARRDSRVAPVMALGLLGAMLLPVAATNEIPHGLRIIGEYASVPLVIAAVIGLTSMVVGAQRSAASSRPMPARVQTVVNAAAAVFIAVLVIVGGAQARRITAGYYTSDVRWHDAAAFSWFYETRREAIATAIATGAASDVVYVPMNMVMHPSFRAFTLRSHPRVQTFATYFGDEAPLKLSAGRFLITQGQRKAATFAAFMPDGTIVLLPRFDEETVQHIHEQALASTDILNDAYGEPAAVSFSFPIDGSSIEIAHPVEHRVDINYDNQVRLVGWDAPLALPQNGAPVSVTLYLQRAPRTGRDLYFFGQLWSGSLERISSSEQDFLLRWVYPPNVWQTDDIVPYEVLMPAPEDAVSGVYYAAAGLRDHHNVNLPVLGPDGQPASDMAIVGALKVPRVGAISTEGMIPVEATFGDAIGLIGYRIADEAGEPIDTLSAGQTATVTLYWQALRESQADYTAFLHVLDPAGSIAAQSDVKPDGGAYPTLIWDAGEIVTTVHPVTIATGAEGPFALYTGWYSFPTLERLTVTQNGQEIADRLATVFAP
jgi:hypothetical protein